jgi:hypothetical protein
MGVIQFRRRTTGAAGAPSALKSGEPAYNMMDNTLYIGFGDDGSGNATSIKTVGGDGSFVTLSSANQTIGGTKTFSNSPIVPATPIGSTDATSKQYVDLQDAQKANVSSPLFNGIPQAPTASPGTNTGQIATTAFVQAALPVASSTTPAANGTAAVGSGTTYARADHVHPSDTTKLNVTGGTLTGALELAADPASALQAATKQYVDSVVTGAAGGLIFKGGWDASAGTFPGGGAATQGWFYRVSVAGTVNGVLFTVGDDIYAITGSASASTYAGNWQKIEGALTQAEIVAALGYTPPNPSNNLSEYTAGAATVRTNLGLVIGTNIQAYSANLAAWSALATSAKQDALGFTPANPSNNLSEYTAGAATVRTNLGLVIGTNVQAYSANLAAWSALATSAKQDALGYTPANPANNLSEYVAGAASARSNLGLGTMATQAASGVNITGGTIGASVTVSSPIDGGTF